MPDIFFPSHLINMSLIYNFISIIFLQTIVKLNAFFPNTTFHWPSLLFSTSFYWLFFVNL